MRQGPDEISRRSVLAGAVGILVLPLAADSALATPETMVEAMDEVLGKGAPIKPGRVKIELPELAENGNSVPLRLTVWISLAVRMVTNPVTGPGDCGVNCTWMVQVPCGAMPLVRQSLVVTSLLNPVGVNGPLPPGETKFPVLFVTVMGRQLLCVPTT